MARLRRKKLILPMAVLAVIVIGLLVAFIVLSRGSMSLDAVRRTISYMGEEKTDSGMVGEMTFVNHSGSFIEQYGDGLIVASRTGVELLDSTGETVEQIAAQVGYEEKGQFYRAFKEKFGCTPTQYRRSAGGPHGGESSAAKAEPVEAAPSPEDGAIPRN